MKRLTPIEARRALLREIAYDPDPEYSGQPLELPSNFLLKHVFTDVFISEWCRAVGVTFKVNKNPDPAFNSLTTIIFRCKLQFEEENDEDL